MRLWSALSRHHNKPSEQIAAKVLFSSVVLKLKTTWNPNRIYWMILTIQKVTCRSLSPLLYGIFDCILPIKSQVFTFIHDRRAAVHQTRTKKYVFRLGERSWKHTHTHTQQNDNWGAQQIQANHIWALLLQFVPCTILVSLRFYYCYSYIKKILHLFGSFIRLRFVSVLCVISGVQYYYFFVESFIFILFYDTRSNMILWLFFCFFFFSIFIYILGEERDSVVLLFSEQYLRNKHISLVKLCVKRYSMNCSNIDTCFLDVFIFNLVNDSRFQSKNKWLLHYFFDLFIDVGVGDLKAILNRQINWKWLFKSYCFGLFFTADGSTWEWRKQILCWKLTGFIHEVSNFYLKGISAQMLYDWKSARS